MLNGTEHVMRCPKCFGRDVRPSRKGSFLDSIMEKIRRTPFRCRGCHSRFYVYVPRDKDEAEETAEAAGTPGTQSGQADHQRAHNPDVAKPAEP